MALFGNGLKSSSLSARMLTWLIPPVVLIILATGYIAYSASLRFVNIALERVIMVQTLALAHEIETFLETCKKDLLFIAQAPPDAASLRNHLARLRDVGGRPYSELAYISQTGDGHVFLVAQDDRMIALTADQIADIKPNPFLLPDKFRDLAPGEVRISPVTAVERPFPRPEYPGRKIQSRLIRFAAPARRPDANQPGLLLLSVDARRLRNILSLYNSPQSPIYAYSRSPEIRFSYFFDMDGWMLFQSEAPDQPDRELNTDLARSAFTGALGKPDLPAAFRPASVFGPFWKMVGDVREGKRNLIRVRDREERSEVKEYFMAYAPIRFFPGKDAPETIYGGLAYVDRSRLTLRAGYKLIDVMFITTLVTVFLVSLLIYFLGRFITRPILMLSREVAKIQDFEALGEIHLPYSGYEISVLQRAVNDMIGALQRQGREIEAKERMIASVSLKERARLEEEIPDGGGLQDGGDIAGIVGFGPKIDRLRSEIIKAAQADADVLIIGETGTGKQLTAEAVHRHSRRAARPFISINCGELDENLLLDTLFGHIKGAFTEAKTDRKGAFLEAAGGTLFLDEIQTASPGVQQALLRAVALRKIKPLGSDREADADVRLIAATNADLKKMIDAGAFRSDLYFRLKVITIQTPALRDQKENIPALIRHFLRLAEMQTGRKGRSLSKGALEKMKQYDWPGNVRELMNSIIRAVIMAEGPLIHAEDILLESEEPPPATSAPETAERPPPPPAPETEGAVSGAYPDPAAVIPAHIHDRLNPRQRAAYPVILRNGAITRSQYQELAEGDLSPRMAVYDLTDMVKKGLLKKVGKGPATRYVPLPPPG